MVYILILLCYALSLQHKEETQVMQTKNTKMLRNSALSVMLIVLFVYLSYFYVSNATSSAPNQPVVNSEKVDESPVQTDVKLVGPSFHSTSFDSSVGFVIPIGYGHLKICFENYGSSPVAITLRNAESGKEYWPNGKTVDGGKNFVWTSFDNGYAEGMRSGTYTLTVTGGGSKVNAEVWGETASSIGNGD